MTMDKGKPIALDFRERMFIGHCIEEWFRQCGTTDQEQWQKDVYKLMTGEEIKPFDWEKKNDKSIHTET